MWMESDLHAEELHLTGPTCAPEQNQGYWGERLFWGYY